MNSHFYILLNNYFLGIATDEEFQDLENIIKNDPEACKEYIEYTSMDADLRSFALEEDGISTPKKTRRFPALLFATASAAAIVILFLLFQKPPSVATVHSIEGEFKSLQPILTGSRLLPGIFELKSGSATLKLNSGADLNLKGPLKFEIVSDMQIKVLRGSLSVYVRESEKGFRVDCPHGYAIDEGTRFSVNVLKDNSSRFMVSDGLISLHHNSGKEALLNANQNSIMTRKSIKAFTILNTLGDETSVVEDPTQIQKGAVDPRFLLVKKSGLGFKNSRRSFFTFQFNEHKTVESAQLTLNYVPTGMGSRKTMPEISQFELYGIPDGVNEQWKRNGMTWQEAPKVKELQLLASFSVSRETVRDTVIIASAKLAQFIKEDNNGELGFVISCKTPGGKMVHGFASSKYSEEEEPKLEIFYPSK